MNPKRGFIDVSDLRCNKQLDNLIYSMKPSSKFQFSIIAWKTLEWELFPTMFSSIFSAHQRLYQLSNYHKSTNNSRVTTKPNNKSTSVHISLYETII